ncbi:hypothetical protein B0681_00850 [Moraxella porci DSM 25326]|uniref:Uncharacterized protein n=1 Tax=Moraxella porci DSM 25326 TaxID=573983 RepID=A0A1T0CVT6_9GAMM|nr:hypothetical protein B0681_00850 [Moraxella porci DSM 25326]
MAYPFINCQAKLGEMASAIDGLVQSLLCAVSVNGVGIYLAVHKAKSCKFIKANIRPWLCYTFFDQKSRLYLIFLYLY